MAPFYSLCTLFILCFGILTHVRANSVHPNIIFIIADDLGWDDVSFHGSNQVMTPNIDLLAYTGVALERHYSHCVCTPSRAALLTGKFAHTTGMQGYPLTNGEDRGLPITEKILPEYLKDLGYATHLVGKWHVGGSRTEYLPTSRGFDSHFGFRGGYIDYYEYTSEGTWDIGKVAGMDFYRNLSAAWDVEGYTTDLFTDEAKSIIKAHDATMPLFLMVAQSAPHGSNDGAILQAPPEVVRAMRYVESPERRVYTAMMKKLDDSVGDIVEALLTKNKLNNTIVVFITDNGGMPTGGSKNYASNWPLKGSKYTPFEGGIRTGAFLWTSTLNLPNHLWKGYIHIVDWLPTLLKGVGAEPPSNIDGKDLWSDIIANQPSKRTDFYEIYTYGEMSFSSIVSGDYKLIVGNVTKEYSEHNGDNFRGIIGSGPCYMEQIENSKVYSVLQKIGQPLKMNDISLRNNIQIDCKALEKDNETCFKKDGAFCLFNINEDPCETRDLSDVHSDIVGNLLAQLQAEMSRVVERPSYPLFRDPRALPSLHNYTWSTWANNL